MRRWLRPLLLSGLSTGLGLLLTGCVLHSMFAQVEVVDSISDQVHMIFAAIDADSTVAICRPTGAFQDCVYIIDGQQVPSGVYLFSEFGIAGVIMDPLIAQVPSDVYSATGTYDLGSGPQPLLLSTVGSFKVTNAISVSAEPGTKFLIFELPPSVEAMLPTDVPTNGLPISYSVQYVHNEPIGQAVPTQTVKLMLAGRVTLNGHKYYVPLLPCVTDFALVPALTLPAAGSPQNMQPALGALSAEGCHNQVYFFNPEPPVLDQKVYLPIVRR
jgi:hypothetical protein